MQQWEGMRVICNLVSNFLWSPLSSLWYIYRAHSRISLKTTSLSGLSRAWEDLWVSATVYSPWSGVGYGSSLTPQPRRCLLREEPAPVEAKFPIMHPELALEPEAKLSAQHLPNYNRGGNSVLFWLLFLANTGNNTSMDLNLHFDSSITISLNRSWLHRRE